MQWSASSIIAGVQLGWQANSLGAAAHIRGHGHVGYPTFGADRFPALLPRSPMFNTRALQHQQAPAVRTPMRRYRRGQCLMGVKGLTGYLKRYFAGAAPVEQLHEGDTLAIDGAGWVFEILRGMRVDHCGDYDALHEATCREVERLRRAGLRLRVFKDGSSRKMKRMTRLKRREEVWFRFGQLYGYTLDGGGEGGGTGLEEDEGGDGGPDRTVNSFPLPMMAKRQFYASLYSAGVEVVMCPGEADQEVARASASDSTGRTFVLGADSDYHIFEGCRYIHFNSLTVDGDQAEAPVWTRARLAELCKLSEQQVVEWALIMGNDYTKNISCSEINVPRYVLDKPAKARKYVSKKTPDYKVEAVVTNGDRGDASADGNSNNNDSGGGEEATQVTTTNNPEVKGTVVGTRTRGKGHDAEINGKVSDVSAAEGANGVSTEARSEVDSEAAEAYAAGSSSALAFEFSRALYALESLDRFPEDEDIDDSPVNEDDDDNGLTDVVTAVVVGDEEDDKETAGLSPTDSRGSWIGGSDSGGDAGEREGGSDVGEFSGGSRQGEERVAHDELGPEEVDVAEDTPEAELARRPFGNAVIQAVKRTLAGSKDDIGGSKEERERGGTEEDVEADAKCAALWGVALGERMTLPDTVRVKGIAPS